jgi:hypothetical protein
VELTDRTSATRDQLMVTASQQPEHLHVIVAGNWPQVVVSQRDDRCSPSVVRVGLVFGS